MSDVPTPRDVAEAWANTKHHRPVDAEIEQCAEAIRVERARVAAAVRVKCKEHIDNLLFAQARALRWVVEMLLDSGEK